MNENAIVKKRIILVSVLIAVMLLGAALTLIIRKNQQSATSGSYIAYIYKDGELYRTVDLSVCPDEEFTIESDDGSYNVITIKNGDIYVRDASCPDKLCEKMGSAKSSLVPIVCLPNELVIELKNSASSASGSTTDAVTY